MLLDYLGVFGGPLYQSPMTIPTFTAVVSAMYWSRTVAQATKHFDLDYSVDTHVQSSRQAMNTPTGLYIVLACQPALTFLMVITSLAFHKAPIHRGFGMIAILAGVRTDTLKLIKGASFSGKLSKPVQMKILPSVGKRLETEQICPQSEYMLSETRARRHDAYEMMRP